MSEIKEKYQNIKKEFQVQIKKDHKKNHLKLKENNSIAIRGKKLWENLLFQNRIKEKIHYLQIDLSHKKILINNMNKELKISVNRTNKIINERKDKNLKRKKNYNAGKRMKELWENFIFQKRIKKEIIEIKQEIFHRKTQINNMNKKLEKSINITDKILKERKNNKQINSKNINIFHSNNTKNHIT